MHVRRSILPSRVLKVGLTRVQRFFVELSKNRDSSQVMTRVITTLHISHLHENAITSHRCTLLNDIFSPSLLLATNVIISDRGEIQRISPSGITATRAVSGARGLRRNGVDRRRSVDTSDGVQRIGKDFEPEKLAVVPRQGRGQQKSSSFQ